MLQKALKFSIEVNLVSEIDDFLLSGFVQNRKWTDVFYFASQNLAVWEIVTFDLLCEKFRNCRECLGRVREDPVVGSALSVGLESKRNIDPAAIHCQLNHLSLHRESFVFEILALIPLGCFYMSDELAALHSLKFH